MNRVLFALALCCACVGVALGNNPAIDYCQATWPTPQAPDFSSILAQVHVYHRHGDRSPTSNPPQLPQNEWVCNAVSYNQIFSTDQAGAPNPMLNTPNAGVLKGNCTLGQLTNKGFDQTFALGQALFNTYSKGYNFLDPTYNYSYPQWLARASSDTLRTLQSAQGVVAGFYGAETLVPIYTTDPSVDPVLVAPSSICPGWISTMEKVSNTPEYINFLNASVFAIATEYAKVLNISYAEAEELVEGSADDFGSVYCHNLTLPPGITVELIGQGIAGAMAGFEYLLNSTKGFEAAFFFTHMLPYLNNAGNAGPAPTWPPNSDKLKMIQWSGHDAGVLMILASLGLAPYEGVIPYAGWIAFELWNNWEMGIYNVRVVYDNVPQPLGCVGGDQPPYMCSLADFNAWLESTAMPPNWQQLCNPSPGKKKSIVDQFLKKF